MKGDASIQQQIEKALKANTLLGGSEIDVAVQEGKVSLTGKTDKFPKKELARRIARDVQGVKSAIEKIRVTLHPNEMCSDDEIALAILEKFIKNFGESHTDISVLVKDGVVRLEGRMKWKYQKDLAAECILNVKGITDIENNITIREKFDISVSEKDVFAAIYGDSSITTDIRIEIIGNRVMLKGEVYSIEQKNLVTQLVRNVSGVEAIENFLIIVRMA